MVNRPLEGGDIGLDIDPRRFERHEAGIRQPDVRGRIIGRRAQRPFERLTRAADGIAIQPLERRTPFNEGAIRSD